jgi:A/G-specific adenine glycosylase
VALAEGRPLHYPVKTRKLRRGHRENALLCLLQGDRVWLVQRPERGVWAGLWSLPEYPTVTALDALTADWPGQGVWLPAFEHALTHFDWRLHPLCWRLPPDEGLADRLPLPHPWPHPLPPGRWVERTAALALGLPVPVRRLLTA